MGSKTDNQSNDLDYVAFQPIVETSHDTHTYILNRAWYTIGISLRHAQAAGLHLRPEDPSLSADRKTSLSRVWWALHSIESALTAITGRPRVTMLKDITVTSPETLIASKDRSSAKRPAYGGSPLKMSQKISEMDGFAEPSKLPSETQLRETFLNAYIEIDIITHKVLATLYSPRTAPESWKQMQKEVASLLLEVEEWALRALPHGILASTALKDEREYFLLYLYYSSVKIYVTRPCLCRLDLRGNGQSEESAGFDKRIAETCVQAALDLTSRLPNHPDPRWLYERGPWWSIVHISMLSISSKVLEIC